MYGQNTLLNEAVQPNSYVCDMSPRKRMDL